jgi:hypothetical protein
MDAGAIGTDTHLCQIARGELVFADAVRLLSAVNLPSDGSDLEREAKGCRWIFHPDSLSSDL